MSTQVRTRYLRKSLPSRPEYNILRLFHSHRNLVHIVLDLRWQRADSAARAMLALLPGYCLSSAHCRVADA